MYQVYARWPASSANTGAAQYTVTHGGGTANVTLNQKQNGGGWVPLGSWSLAPGAGHKVTLAASGEGTIIADAMLFVAAGAQPANLLYVHPDHLGSPQKLTDASQAVVWDGVFDPFGEEVAITGLAAMPLRFPGQYADEETGYRYNYFRNYEPRLGRYIQSDPMGLLAGLNTFAYVGGSPITSIDRFGLWEPGGPAAPGVNTIVCDGAGGITPQIFPKRDQVKCDIVECIEVHENVHAQDALQGNPNVCKGKPRGTQVKVSNRAEYLATEIAGITAELECLKDKLAKECDEECRKVIQERIEDRKRYMEPFIDDE